MINHEHLATFFTCFVMTQWIAIAAVYVFDSVRVHIRTLRAYRLAKSLGNGRALALKVRRDASWKHLTISLVALCVGLASVYRWVFLPHPPADTQIFSMITTEGLVFILFLMWRIKRNNLAYIRKLDQIHDEEDG